MPEGESMIISGAIHENLDGCIVSSPVHSQELYSNPIAPPDQDAVPPLLDQR